MPADKGVLLPVGYQMKANNFLQIDINTQTFKSFDGLLEMCPFGCPLPTAGTTTCPQVF